VRVRSLQRADLRQRDETRPEQAHLGQPGDPLRVQPVGLRAADITIGNPRVAPAHAMGTRQGPWNVVFTVGDMIAWAHGTKHRHIAAKRSLAISGAKIG
jgi:hypothetical protein